MSGVIQRETSIAAGGVNDNIFSGSAFEYVRSPGVVSIGVTASATGTFITIQAGPTLILEESPPVVKTVMPVVPDDFLYQSAVVPATAWYCVRATQRAARSLFGPSHS